MAAAVAGGEWAPTFGAKVRDGEVSFRVWAPAAETVEVLLGRNGSDGRLRMEARDGVHEAHLSRGGAPLYSYSLDGGPSKPDPASLSQPEGVHGPSLALDTSSFEWHDRRWGGVPQRDLVIYELHTGTYTPEGTFDAIAARLEHLKQRLGVTALELMPVGQFPGARDWGYDGVYPYAVQNTYGGARRLAALVDACHAVGLGVVLDVVYNHLGPEGNYLGEFGPYFSDRYTTPWGRTLNFDGPGSDQVRRFVIDNALYWVRCLHVDGLRLDAVHGIFDSSPKHILQELAEEVHSAAEGLGRKVCVIAESDLNDPRIVKGTESCGYGVDAQWADDLHHALHSAVTGERFGYYQDYRGVSDVAKAFAEPFVLDGRYSGFRGRRHGAPSADVPGERFVVFAQNHDQVGNRADGARLPTTAGLEGAKAVAAAVILSPYVPLLFMGEEYGSTSPFYFFCDYGDDRVVQATREGRRRELAAQGGRFVDPQEPGTFAASGPEGQGTDSEEALRTLEYYSSLIRFRREHGAVRSPRSNTSVSCFEGQAVVAIRRWDESEQLLLVLALGRSRADVRELVDEGRWVLGLSSSPAAPESVEPGSAVSFPAPSASVYLRT